MMVAAGLEGWWEEGGLLLRAMSTPSPPLIEECRQIRRSTLNAHRAARASVKAFGGPKSLVLSVCR